MTVFHYRKEPFGEDRSYIWRPVADIFLKGLHGVWMEFHPYIDSGADVTIIPFSLGKLIGLSIGCRPVERIGGIRGSIPIVHVRHHVNIGGRIIFARMAWSLVEKIPPLLGRADVFDVFHVTFQQDKKIILFKD